MTPSEKSRRWNRRTSIIGDEERSSWRMNTARNAAKTAKAAAIAGLP